MSNRPINRNRRQAIKLIAGGVAAIPLAGLMTSGTAVASDLPHVTEDDPIAVGLKYKHDATQARCARKHAKLRQLPARPG